MGAFGGDTACGPPFKGAFVQARAGGGSLVLALLFSYGLGRVASILHKPGQPPVIRTAGNCDHVLFQINSNFGARHAAFNGLRNSSDTMFTIHVLDMKAGFAVGVHCSFLSVMAGLVCLLLLL